MQADIERRFAGVSRLYGKEGAVRLQSAHVCVIGIGGVGSWAVEALARSYIGELTLIDLDMVAESNTNRQIHALEGNFGKSKVSAMKERIEAINPDCKINIVEDFVTVDNVAAIVPHCAYVIDAIDQLSVKMAIVLHCKHQEIPVIVAGAAGGQLDPSQIKISDLSLTIQDPILSKLRSKLRREHGYPRDPKKKFGIRAVFSTEQLRYPAKNNACEINEIAPSLNCAGFGSSICITSVFGMFAAAQAINFIANTK